MNTMNLLIYILINSFAVFVAAQILPGVSINNFITAVVVAVVLGVINTFLKPILVLLTLPITILTLGLFMFILNGILILLVSAIVPGFKVHSILWAILLSIVISLVSSFLNSLASPAK